MVTRMKIGFFYPGKTPASVFGYCSHAYFKHECYGFYFCYVKNGITHLHTLPLTPGATIRAHGTVTLSLALSHHRHTAILERFFGKQCNGYGYYVSPPPGEPPLDVGIKLVR